MRGCLALRGCSGPRLWCWAPSSPPCRLQDIDGYILRARERGYETMVRFGKRGLNLAATAAVQAAAKVLGGAGPCGPTGTP